MNIIVHNKTQLTFSYRDHIDWNTSKIISRPNSFRSLLTVTPTRATWCNLQHSPN